MSEDPRKAALLEQARAHLFRSSKDYGEPIIARGRGATLVDTDGKEYLDFGSGQMAASIGHNHPAITEALKRSSERILHLNTHLISEEVIELGKSLADLLPQQLQKVLLLSTGGEFYRGGPEGGEDVHRPLRGGGAGAGIPRSHGRSDVCHILQRPGAGTAPGCRAAWPFPRRTATAVR